MWTLTGAGWLVGMRRTPGRADEPDAGGRRLQVASSRARAGSLLGIGLGAPVTAEFLQAYLSSTGDARALLGALLILAPLYGGAALMIREVAVRTGRGWTGILLLAAGFGVLMPGLVDLAMFGEHRDDVAYWEQLRTPTLVGPLGISAFTTLTWVVGHVALSIGAPLAVHRAVAPSTRDRPLLGRWGITVTAVLWALTAALIHTDGRRIYGHGPSAGQATVVLLVVAALVAAGMSDLGRPVPARPDARRLSVAAVLGAGIGAKLAVDLLPPTWLGFAAAAGVVAAALTALRAAATRRRWRDREIGVLGASLVLGGALIGFAAPTPQDVPLPSKLAQNAVLLALAVLVTWIVLRRTAETRATPDPPCPGVLRPSST